MQPRKYWRFNWSGRCRLMSFFSRYLSLSSRIGDRTEQHMRRNL
jgi:hypothetical protein